MNRFEVKVLGSSYFVTTSDPEEKIRQVEKSLNDNISDIRLTHPELSALEVLVLIALNLTDQSTKDKLSLDNLRSQVAQYATEANGARTSAQSDYDELKKNYDDLKAELYLVTQERNQLSEDLKALNNQSTSQMSFGGPDD